MRELDASGVYLLFPGQGSQYPRMGASLYRTEPTFTHWMDEAFRLMGCRGAELRDAWLSTEPSAAFDDVTVAQPLLYAFDHALGRMVLDWGVRPRGLLGHSVGELAAATLAGVMTFADGVALMMDRVRTFADAPGGGMLAVAASEEQVRSHLGDDVYLAAVNGPRQVLLAGTWERLDAMTATLDEAGLTYAMTKSRQPFHSPLVGDAVRASLPAWHAVEMSPPSIPVISAYVPGELTNAVAVDRDFWAWQPARTVRFFDALQLVLAERPAALVECGAGGGLTAVARRLRPATRMYALLPHSPRTPEDAAAQIFTVRTALGELAGVAA